MSDDNQAAQPGSEQEFIIQRTYLKDLSLEVPMGPQAFLVQDQPAMNQDLETEISKIADDVYETVLKLTITATVEDNTLFLIEVKQAGIFSIKGIEEANLAHVLNTLCPQILFPYAREVIDSVLVKATFQPLMLPPVNFDLLYANALEERQKEAEGSASPTH